MTDDLLKDVRTSVYLGEMDDHLDTLLDAIQDRQSVLTQQMWKELVPGALVRFNNKARPKYLIGVPATVDRRKQSKVVVKIGKTVGRFEAGIPITTSPRILDLISPPSVE